MTCSRQLGLIKHSVQEVISYINVLYYCANVGDLASVTEYSKGPPNTWPAIYYVLIDTTIRTEKIHHTTTMHGGFTLNN